MFFQCLDDGGPIRSGHNRAGWLKKKIRKRVNITINLCSVRINEALVILEATRTGFSTTVNEPNVFQHHLYPPAKQHFVLLLFLNSQSFFCVFVFFCLFFCLTSFQQNTSN